MAKTNRSPARALGCPGQGWQAQGRMPFWAAIGLSYLWADLARNASMDILPDAPLHVTLFAAVLPRAKRMFFPFLDSVTCVSNIRKRGITSELMVA